MICVQRLKLNFAGRSAVFPGLDAESGRDEITPQKIGTGEGDDAPSDDETKEDDVRKRQFEREGVKPPINIRLAKTSKISFRIQRAPRLLSHSATSFSMRESYFTSQTRFGQLLGVS
jgi:hypothetical protein